MGAFYVHEYKIQDGKLEKAAIDFVQVCEPRSSNILEESRPKLLGSIRYQSEVPNSCDDKDCRSVKDLLLSNSNTQPPETEAGVASDKVEILSEIITLSESGDYIGGGQSWNLSTKTKCKISASWPREDSVGFSVECFNFMTAVSFQFASE